MIQAETEDALIVALATGNTKNAQRIVETSPVDFALLLDRTRRHMISAVIMQRLAALSVPEPQKSEIAMSARHAVVSALATSAAIRKELRRLTEILEPAGIGFLLLKGYAIDKNPLRRMNDIDILIRQPDLDAAFVVLQSHGYFYEGSGVLSQRERERPKTQLAWNNQFQFRSPEAQISVEVHINLFERDRIRLERLDRLLDAVEVFWEGAVRDPELGCLVPSREASLALLCVHSATKRSPAHNTYILRHAYDIVHVLAAGIDHDRFLELCRTWDIRYFAVVSLRLAALALGDEAPHRLAERLEAELSAAERHLVVIHLACYRGLGRASTYHRARYTIAMPFAIAGSIVKGLRWYLKFLFPPLWHQEQRFGIKRTSPLIIATYVIGPFLRVLVAFKERDGRR